MSVVAWDGVFLAADTYCQYGDLIRTESKLHQIDETTWMGFVGDLQEGLLIRDWMRGDIEKPTQSLKNVTCMIARRDKLGNGVITIMEEMLHEIPMSAPKYAIGCGKELTMGAMLAGASARQAIELIAPIHPNVATPVEYFKVIDDIPF